MTSNRMKGIALGRMDLDRVAALSDIEDFTAAARAKAGEPNPYTEFSVEYDADDATLTVYGMRPWTDADDAEQKASQLRRIKNRLVLARQEVAQLERELSGEEPAG